MKLVAKSYMAFVYAFLYIPIVVLIIYSFNNSQYSLVWHGFTWYWYRQLFTDSALLTAAWHSLILGFFAASFACTIGVFIASSLFLYRFSSRNLLYLTVFVLLLLPDIVLGIALLVLFNQLHFPLGFFSLLLSHITFSIPFVIIIAYSRLATYDRNMVEAAIDLGANYRIVFQRIILPLLIPSIIAAWLLSFTLSLDDVIISYFVSGPSFQILPLQIFAMVRLGVTPEINALASIILLFTFLFVVISHVTMRKK